MKNNQIKNRFLDVKARVAGLWKAVDLSRGEALPWEETAATLQAALVLLSEAEGLVSQSSEELREEGQLADAERISLQSLFGFAPTGYLVTDREGLIVRADEAAAALLGISSDVLKGQPINRILSEHPLPTFVSALP